VVELIQEEATVDDIVIQASRLLTQDMSDITTAFSDIQRNLRCNASKQAAHEVLSLINK